ncbi:hypothetical protein M433DRAFT_194001 [Acidomyces richmondensis BFW]|nr:hypothetical protein M433DRAFT_194001 [Acidomyces richmondensis BFW]
MLLALSDQETKQSSRPEILGRTLYQTSDDPPDPETSKCSKPVEGDEQPERRVQFCDQADQLAPPHEHFQSTKHRCEFVEYDSPVDEPADERRAAHTDAHPQRKRIYDSFDSPLSSGPESDNDSSESPLSKAPRLLDNPPALTDIPRMAPGTSDPSSVLSAAAFDTANLMLTVNKGTNGTRPQGTLETAPAFAQVLKALQSEHSFSSSTIDLFLNLLNPDGTSIVPRISDTTQNVCGTISIFAAATRIIDMHGLAPRFFSETLWRLAFIALAAAVQSCEAHGDVDVDEISASGQGSNCCEGNS